MKNLTLILNTGSTSRRYSVFDGELHIQSAHIESVVPGKNYLAPLLQEWRIAPSDIASVGIRVVAPGTTFRENALIDVHYKEQLTEALNRAPLHIGGVLQELKELETELPHAKLVGVSDSKFHSTLPDYARVYALPKNVREEYGIERQGYHGLSTASALSKIAKRLGAVPSKIIFCHLGGGTSVTALKNGTSLDTSMGWTPLEGVPMAKRSGNIDPGILAFLVEKLSLKGSELETLLSTSCGLEAVSGIEEGNMKKIIETQAQGDPCALLAFRLYVHSVRKYIGAMATVLRGCDSLVLTGAIGEGAPIMRRALTEGLEFLGIGLDTRKNATCVEVEDFELMGSGHLLQSVIVVKSDETSEILRETLAFLKQ